MDINNFVEFEKKVMEMLLKGDDAILELLREQYNTVKIKERKFTDTGFFTTFDVKDKNVIIPNCKSFNFGDIVGEMENLKYGIGFILFIKDGILNILEGYTYEEKWPKIITKYQFHYISGNERDLNKLREKWK